ncbi:MAG: hypothetical protein ACLUVC_12710 [Longibaculum sp.]
MRFIKIDISDIDFDYQNYSQSLYDSIERIGFSFPIHVEKKGTRYVCKDGKKRLSVLKDILKKNPHYHRGSQVCVLIENNESTRSNDCWRGRNTH